MHAGRRDDADVIVVGAGPAGSATAHWCASAGLDVLLLEKASFPRDKVCGDGLTPRAVAELARMGVDTREDDGWIRNEGLRVVAGGRSWELAWPDLASYPSYGMARSRATLDHLLAQHAQASGAKLLERTKVTGPLLDERSGRVAGVTAQLLDGRGRADGETRTYRAPVVVAADGVSSRFATALGLTRRDDRPIGTAVRTYYRTAGTPRHEDAFMESHLELWDGAPGASTLLPGYGWIFALGDGTANVGLGSVSSTPARQSASGHDYRALMDAWVRSTPAEWGFTPENQVGPVRGAALPMGFNRTPLYRDGAVLVGDAAGMVSPFNGEGIAYALQAGRVAADAITQARTRTTDDARERTLATYADRMRADLGGYYTLGRWFVRLIEHPAVMRACVRHGLPRPVVMRFVLKLLSDCYEPRGGDWVDRVIAGLTRVVPAA
ncbi:geranylgeranyl reductase family protein [Isoptericola variabilis]|uniref:Geranylgeranyl reductase n=1 Tax=Isoptericola variabilis (strain 225) TaxID=743718 RepID=F6FV96_ISOV2|nr:geranylgeranyl reductase family protein [Isoptericola variabilis]AEG43369.1 geranylgeranyl reductase [Isoptericola variabilis 225]TWH34578.1 geranylgeranyl reductase family protein [Isoptericola variabilis J7]